MIIATAGHVDHGKTLLVKALTGVDTDRLPDEKKRGLTIDLGFAYQAVGEGETLGFIDVPGHERFIRNALCGLAGTDFVLLIVAADDGIMPQTREHLAIVDLLGIDKGAVALTKIDRVSAERIEEVSNDATSLLTPTALAGIPIFPLSAMTGEGVDKLSSHLAEVAQTTEKRSTSCNFRLAVDRKFDVSGAGMVVTGTVFSGSVTVGDAVEILGHDMSLRVRGIHAQNSQAERGNAGQRCALNLAGPELRKEQIGRGDWVVAGPVPVPVAKFDAEISVLASEARAMSHWTPVHVHLGAAETTGRVALLEAKSLEPGEKGLAQIVLDNPIGAVFGDRAILRDQSAQRTIAGGMVIDLYPPRRGRAKPDRIAWIRAMAAADDKTALTRLLAISPSGVDIAQFGRNRNLTPAELSSVVSMVKAKAIATPDGNLAFSPARWTALCEAVTKRLADWHAATPGAVGLGDNRVLEGTGIKVTRPTAGAIAAELVREKLLVREGLGVRLPQHEAKLQGADGELWERLKGAFQRTKLRPVTARELAQDESIDHRKMESFLTRAGRLGLVAKISKTRYATPAMLVDLARIAEQLGASAPDSLLNVQAFRDASGIGRNMAIEVLEYFDRQKFTQRHGDGRVILQPADKAFGKG